ncbi:MAG: hypothetical protein GTO05_11935, partial [Gemmatimonadales bacterium]|nr:hypothetical protein [Gemmatimonadales bacterium]
MARQRADTLAIACALAVVAVSMMSLGATTAVAGVTERVSVAVVGGEPNGESMAPALSADGRFVAFHSEATNLVVGDTNGAMDVFRYDRDTGDTIRVSVATAGAEGNAGSYDPAISADGRYVAFDSDATNLVADDTNGAADVFVHDCTTGETSRVSVTTMGAQGNYGSYYPAISSDGRYVAFESDATNLVAGDLNFWTDVFVHDRETGETTRVSVTSGGVEGDDGSYWPAISGDGRYVAFESDAINLVAGDFNFWTDVFVHDRQTGET